MLKPEQQPHGNAKNYKFVEVSLCIMHNVSRTAHTHAAAALAFCLAAIMLASCHKAKPSWDDNILAPIINASLSINNLLADTLVKSNPDSSVTLVYNGSLYNINNDSLVKIPDTTLFYTYGSIFGTFTVNPGQYILYPNNQTTTYGINTAEVTKATIQSGYVDVEVTSHINQPTDVTYKIPSATLNNNPLVFYIRVPAKNGAVLGYAQKIYSLAGYAIDFTGPSHNLYNTISTSVSGIVDSNASVATINYGDSLIIKARFYQITPAYARGYFGTVTKTYTQQAPFPLFSKVVSGTLNLQNMSVTLSLKNSFGADARINLSALTSINTHTTNTVSLADADIINKDININRATETHLPSPPVTPSVQNFSITPSNSNLLAWADNLPDYIGYTIHITTDPLGNVSGYNDFMYNGYGISSQLTVSVPLAFIANNLTLEDTLSVNFSGSAQAQSVESALFIIYASNGFPFSAGMQIYLLDNNKHIVDSLLIAPKTIAAGIINGSGIVTSPVSSVLTAPLNMARTQLLLNTKSIIIRSTFNMGAPYYKIYDYYRLNVKLVGNFDYRINK